MRGPRALGAALLVVTSFFATLLSLEIGFRAVEALRLRIEPPWALYDPELGYRLNPARDGINDDGLRDHPVPAKSQRLRILMLGDSVAYSGDDVDDTYVGHLRRSLHETPGAEEVEVLNASVPGYTNYQELLYLARDGVRLEPDRVGVGFVLNDLFRFLHQFRVEAGQIVGNRYQLTTEAVGKAETDTPLWRHSVFLGWLQRRLSAIDRGGFGVAPEGYPFERRPDFRNAWQDPPWRAIEAQLREMRQLGERRGFRVFVVLFPFGAQYQERDLARDRRYVLKPQRELREICERLELPFLDLYPLLDRSRDLLGDGIHLSAAGRRRVGAVIAGFLSQQGLLAAADGASASGALQGAAEGRR